MRRSFRTWSARRAVVVASAILLAGPVSLTLAGPASADPATGYVVPISWDRFDAGLPGDEQSDRSRSILLNTNRYALQTWYPRTYGGQTGDYLDLGGTGEANIRPPGSEALALATSLATGAYDESVTGAPVDEATDVAVRITASIAYQHEANHQNGWGDAWQSALWAFNAAFAGWLLWDDLPAADQENLARMVVVEANRFLHYEVPYYQRPDGTVVTPGDSKAEENAWNAAFLNLAVSMMPDHPNVAVWRDKAIDLMISAYSRPSDLRNDTVVNGKAVRDWLNGSNIFDDGTLVNHSIIHPDYFTSIANSAGAPLTYGLAGLPTPRAALFNADIVYHALVDHQFTSPPYHEPGGTIYVHDGDGHATAGVYYPQGNDWGTSRQMHFLLLDTLAETFGFDHDTSIPASDWAAAHATRALEMQSRFPDGRTYGPPSEDTYSGREQWVALLAGRTYLTLWLAHNGGVRLTNQAYPVTPRDCPGGSLSLDAAPGYPKGVATPLSVTLRSRTDEPLQEVSFHLSLPPGWTAQPDGEPVDTVEPGEDETMTWRLTPGGSAKAGETAELGVTADYRHRGLWRQLDANAFVAVPPGVNLALGRPVTASSALRETSGGGKTVDGLFTDASRWLSAVSDTSPWLVVDLGTPVDIDSVYVYSGYTVTNNDSTSTLKDFTIDVRTQRGWTTVAEFENNITYKVVADDLDVTGDQVRLSVSKASGSSIDITRVFEVEVYGAPPS